MNWKKSPDGTWRAIAARLPFAYAIKRDRLARLYIPTADGKSIKPFGKPGYFVLEDAKKCCLRHAAAAGISLETPVAA